MAAARSLYYLSGMAFKIFKSYKPLTINAMANKFQIMMQKKMFSFLFFKGMIFVVKYGLFYHFKIFIEFFTLSLLNEIYKPKYD